MKKRLSIIVLALSLSLLAGWDLDNQSSVQLDEVQQATVSAFNQQEPKPPIDNIIHIFNHQEPQP